MAKIHINGLASGLPPNLVDQLVAAERAPLKEMENKKAKQETRLKLVQYLQSKLSGITESLTGLTSVRGFSDMKLTTGNPNVVGGSVDPNTAQDGSWNVEVKSLAQKAAALTNGFPDKNKTQVGVGYFRFETKNGEKEVYIDGKHSTLQGVASAINAAGVGVRASVIDDQSNPDAPYKLMISGVAVGDNNQVKYPTLYFLDGDQDLYFDKQKEAKNGVISVDGFDFQVGSNNVKDVIPGVTLDLHQAAPGKTVNIAVKEDRTAVAGKVQKFVDGMNAVLSFIQKQDALTKDTDTSTSLGGDGLLRSVEMRLRNLIQNPQYGVGSKITLINQLGIEFNRNGTLQFDKKKFDAMLNSDPVAVQKFLQGDGFNTGFIPSVQRQMNVLLDGGYGPVTLRLRSLQDRIHDMDNRIADKERQLTQKEQALRAKFARLETTMARLKSQGSALSGLGAGGSAGGMLSLIKGA